LKNCIEAQKKYCSGPKYIKKANSFQFGSATDSMRQQPSVFIHQVYYFVEKKDPSRTLVLQRKILKQQQNKITERW